LPVGLTVALLDMHLLFDAPLMGILELARI
jgi:hypothetical protein